MRKFSQEELEYYKEKIEEAEESIRLYGTFSHEEFLRRLKKLEEEDRREIESKRKNIKSNTIKPFGKITKKFIRV